ALRRTGIPSWVCPLTAQDTVTQSTGDVIGYEGGSVTLSCTFTTSSTATYILYWYIHHLNGSPKYILQRYTSGAGDTAAEFKDRFDAKIEKTTVPLTIQSAKLFIQNQRTRCVLVVGDGQMVGRSTDQLTEVKILNRGRGH
uniref:Immunoglobulin V-set domain-containing protein n=1 Tax=Scleropages formosus TaxID=113540 RepID=A0A8C9VTP8_SCLFO